MVSLIYVIGMTQAKLRQCSGIHYIFFSVYDIFIHSNKVLSFNVKMKTVELVNDILFMYFYSYVYLDLVGSVFSL